MPSKSKIQQTPLEKHAAFFDTDGDGAIWPMESGHAMHGSDSTSYTAQGDFDKARFDHAFELYTQPPHIGMAYGGAITILNGQRNAYDFFGSLAALFEWFATYTLLWTADGLMKKEDICGIYDGSPFYPLVKSQDLAKNKNK
ncbi:hypothetical protein BDN71DRAFT_1592978 [Pleurotus eryngii]|uniref:Caleosin n=1 Tax=Pleurotus eryngii TaxID=5323 RepID=A0A9P5ZM47_PLEER|nr:hypothetical protein BDN71DRAFT_1592978 [Pleurotus eryngii]